MYIVCTCIYMEWDVDIISRSLGSVKGTVHNYSAHIQPSAKIIRKEGYAPL